MRGLRWARLQADVDCALRRGAWYRVHAVAGLEAIVDVNRKPQAVPSYLLQIVSTAPRYWTVVPGHVEAARRGAPWGEQYVVCPSCRDRAPLPARGRPRQLGCRHCRGVFDVAWHERYLAS